MELFEVSTVAFIDENHDEDCYFCNRKKDPDPLVNDLDDEDVDGLESEGVRFANSSSKLGTALGGRPDDHKVMSKGFASRVAAHHLIPGNASLANSDIMDYLWTDGEAAGNIGYNVNSRPNGVWLPGNYAIRPWGTRGADAAMNPVEYVVASVDSWRCQFHDAHEDYNDWVRGDLNKVAAKLEVGEDLWCPEADKNEDSKDRALVGIVSRLHSISARLKRMLVFPTTGWRSNIFTSSFMLQYMSQRPHQS
jgi:hypothetical protein